MSDLITCKAKKTDLIKILKLVSKVKFETYNLHIHFSYKDYKESENQEFNRRAVDLLSYLNSDNHLIRVVKDGSSIIAYMHLYRTEDKGMIKEVFIDKDYQGKGIGKSLMQIAMHWFEECTQISLFVVETNNNAIEFYKKYGFELTNIEPKKQNPILKRYKMIKRL